MDYELYLPQEWFGEDFAQLYKECHIPEEKTFSTKNEIAVRLLNQAVHSGLFQVRWIGCDAAYGNDHAFLDGLKLPEGVWYFAATNAKEQVFPEYPQMCYPETKRGRPRKHPVLSTKPVSVRETAEDSSAPWESVVLAEGTKGPIVAERKYMRCYSCRKDGNRSYVKPGPEIWLYLRKYARFQCPGKSGCPGTGQGSNLKNHHMLFVMIAHLFTIYMREVFKKKKFH